MAFTNTMKRLGIEQALRMIHKDPEKNLPRILEWVDSVAAGQFEPHRQVLHSIVYDPTHPYYHFVRRLFTDLNPAIMDTLVLNFALNAASVGLPKQEMLRQKHKCNLPRTILLDPVSRANPQCRCAPAASAAPQKKKLLALEELDRVIHQGKALGVYFYVFTGKEPLSRRTELLRLCKRHADCIFLCFTNGRYVDEALVNELLRIRNLIPILSLDGFQADTDRWYGAGAYDACLSAAARLSARKLLFGTSTCYTKENFESVSSEAFYDQLISLGAYFAWFFRGVPYEEGKTPLWLPTDDQQDALYRRISTYRTQKSLFAMELQKDGELIDGCIDTGRCFLHMGAAGTMDPCLSGRSGVLNIRQNTMLEALQSNSFLAHRGKRPFDANALRACPFDE